MAMASLPRLPHPPRRDLSAPPPRPGRAGHTELRSRSHDAKNRLPVVAHGKGKDAQGEEYFAYNKRRWGSDGWTYSLKALGRKVGAPFRDWKWWPNTLKAHCLVHLAQEKGISSATAKAVLFEALYEKGANLSSAKVLAELANEKLALSKEEVLDYLESRQGEQAVLQLVRAGQDIVQGGVPFFIVRGAGQPLGFSGAQPSEQLLQILKKASGDSD
eukprot:s188_g25.t2